MASAKRARIEETKGTTTTASLELRFEAPSPAAAASTSVLVGPQDTLYELSPELLPAGLPVELWRALVAKVKPAMPAVRARCS